jgi:hypothetical protein
LRCPYIAIDTVVNKGINANIVQDICSAKISVPGLADAAGGHQAPYLEQHLHLPFCKSYNLLAVFKASKLL